MGFDPVAPMGSSPAWTTSAGQACWLIYSCAWWCLGKSRGGEGGSRKADDVCKQSQMGSILFAKLGLTSQLYNL